MTRLFTKKCRNPQKASERLSHGDYGSILMVEADRKPGSVPATGYPESRRQSFI
jgi:hypothetical protein